MKRLVAVLLLTSAPLVSASAQGWQFDYMKQPRLSGGAMSCAQAAGAVQQYGSVIISSARSRRIDRFVSSQAYCTKEEVTMPDWIATRDNAQCFVGYRCADNRYPDPPSGGGFNWRFDQW
ncbi:hypothetical protein [Methylocella sp. CPCC 101449]|jgi:hypothetical protein|uniref:hypothetical protein n=1 Tax=Methylocella sp. CPCC 101449 TaxID=2987531 RepID=UPI00288EA665|nr:hypothetical protein [Methylocella sp. CPCC 101449]MDT2021770.1 hypothetical protein [Methylocella sp. CPCC 101449]HEV2571859.1 hypothetical protein [Beijerinckiaceae bacterium]